MFSKKCNEKFVLKINEGTNIEEVLKSGRKFTNLKLSKIKTRRKFVEILNKIGLKIKNLEVFDCELKEDENSEEMKINLPSLNELTISKTNLKIFTCSYKNLKILNLHQVTSPTLITSVLKLNPSITELNLYLNDSCNIFQQEVFNNIFSLNLEYLTISYPSNFEIDDRSLKNIENFLRFQGDTLKAISLINAASLSSVFLVWNSLKVVERFNFFSVDPLMNLEFKRPELKMKESLKTLEIHVLGPMEVSIEEIKPILNASMNLKSLGVWKLNKDLIEYSALYLPNLKNLNCAIIDDENFYEQLKTKNGLNSAIKIQQY